MTRFLTTIICLSFVFSTACVTKHKYDLKEQEAKELSAKLAKEQATKEELSLTSTTARHQLAVAEERNQKIFSKAEILIAKLKECTAENLENQKRLRQLDQELTGTESELNKFKEEQQAIVKKLEGRLTSEQVKVKQLKEGLQVNLLSKLLFASGSARVRKSGRQALRKVVDAFDDIEERQVQIAGHTDNQPLSKKLLSRYGSNWGLSAARAIAVAKVLIKLGVPEKNIVITAHAQFKPLTSNKTAKGRQKNRRIEILLSKIR